jgi:hypothetical protein
MRDIIRKIVARTNKTDALLLAAVLALAVALGFLSSFVSSSRLIMALAALALFVVSFLRVEAALYLLIFSMLLSPEFVVGATETKASLGRGVTLRLDDFLLAIISLGWFAKTAVYKELGLFLKTPLNRPLLLYSLVCIVSTVLGVLTGDVTPVVGFFFVLKYLQYYILYFMVVNHIQGEERVRRFVFCLLLTCFIISVYGVLQIPSGSRVTAPFEGERGEPNTLGGYLVLMASVMGGLWLKIPKTSARTLLLGLLAPLTVAFLFTESRSSYLAITASYITLTILEKRRALLIAVLALAVAAAPLMLPGRVKQRVLHTFQQPKHQLQIKIGDVTLDTSTSVRIMSWREGFRDWTRRPVLGWGITGYSFMDAQFPRVLVETGLLGILAFLYLLHSLFRLLKNTARQLQTPYYQGLATGFLAGFVGLVFHSIGANTFIIVRIMEPFWFLAGIVVMLPGLEEKGVEAPPPKPGGSVRRPGRFFPGHGTRG